jgi:NitT/TauT family transport system substrate-binding protein
VPEAVRTKRSLSSALIAASAGLVNQYYAFYAPRECSVKAVTEGGVRNISLGGRKLMPLSRTVRLIIGFTAFCALAMTVRSQPASAEDMFRVGTPEPRAFNFGMLDAGEQLGIFKKHGLTIQRIDLGGGAKLHQAMVAGAIDAALGGGTDLQFLAKGSPEKAVGQMASSPSNMAIIVKSDSPIKTLADLKGKKIGASTVGSLTSWIALEVARQQGWKPDDITLVYLGNFNGLLSGLTTGAIDAMSGNLEISYVIQDEGKYRILLRGGDLVQDFVSSVIYASDTTIKEKPDQLRRFLAAWFETIQYMHDNEKRAVEIMAKLLGTTPPVATNIYAAEMPSFSLDGRFNRKDLAVVENALLNFHLIDSTPADTAILDESFLPKK